MKKIKKAIIIIILMAGVGTATFFIGRQIGLNTDTSSTSTTIEEVTVGTQNIKKTLTSSGEIKTSNTEKLEISTSYYFETMCVEEDDTVKKGENILKYSNGTYLTAPYDLVISSYSVPETGNKATSSNYIEVQELDNLVVSLSISESEISNISLDQEVQITLTADTYSGTGNPQLGLNEMDFIGKTSFLNPKLMSICRSIISSIEIPIIGSVIIILFISDKFCLKKVVSNIQLKSE